MPDSAIFATNKAILKLNLTTSNKLLIQSVAATLVILFLSTASAFSQPLSKEESTVGKQSFRVVFYNVENLFDTLDHPIKIDEEFTPGTEKKWNTERYEKKLQDLAKVILACHDGAAPDLIGLCEVENRFVVEDLIAKTALKHTDYDIAHFESPDMRGIDVALIYNRKTYRPADDGFPIRLSFPFDTTYTSREILHVNGYAGKGRKNSLHLFINHWPSRRGGLEASEPRRIVAADALKSRIDSVRLTEPKALILAMGDFNDEPSNNSMQKALGAQLTYRGAQNEVLYNLMGPLAERGEGTYNYRGNWNMLDQFIVSGNLLDTKRKWRYVEGSAGRLYQDWLLYKDDRFGPTPSRTYGGPNYYGGISDHLAISLVISKQKRVKKKR